MKPIWRGGMIVALLASATGCTRGDAAENAGRPAAGAVKMPVQVVRLVLVPIQDASEYLAQLVSRTQVAIYPQVSGVVTSLFVKPGQVVGSVDERADLRALRTEVDIAARGIKDDWYQFLPTVTFQSALTSSSDQLAIPSTTWNIEGVLTIPIWDGSRRIAVDAETHAREVDHMTQVGFLTGQGTSLDLVVSAAALRQAQINRAPIPDCPTHGTHNPKHAPAYQTSEQSYSHQRKET